MLVDFFFKISIGKLYRESQKFSIENLRDSLWQRGDCDIMRTAAKLADETYRGIGSVLVATRDSDFRLVRRSLEDAFGFGVVRSARELSQWL